MVRRPRVITFLDELADGGELIANFGVLLALGHFSSLVVDAKPHARPVSRQLSGITSLDITRNSEIEPILSALRAEPAWKEALSEPDLKRYLLPDASGPLDVFTGVLPVPDSVESAAETAVKALGHLRYDYILVRCSPDTVSLSVSDVVVICLPATGTAAGNGTTTGERAARDLAQSCRAQYPGTPVVLAALGSSAPARAPGAGADLIEVALSDGGADGGTGDSLVVLLHQSLPAGFAELVEAVGGDRSADIGGVPAHIRNLYRRRAAQTGDTPAEPIWIAASTADRPWREWIGSVLARAGMEPVALTAEVTGLQAPTLLVVGPVEALPADLQDLVGEVRTRVNPSVIVARTRIAETRTSSRGTDTVDLFLSDRVAVARLRAELMIPAAATRPGAGRRPRYPLSVVDDRHAVNLRTPNRDFVGRDDEIDALRDSLLDRCAAVVTGASGTGKRELASAYAHRFRHDYDVVWWVPAHDRTAAQESLAELQETVGDAGRAPRDDGLRKLLIFHDADDPSALADLLPRADLLRDGNIHLVITSRWPSPRQLAAAGMSEVPPIVLTALSEDDALALILGRVPLVPHAVARQITERLERSPLALHLAAATLRERTAETESVAEAEEYAGRIGAFEHRGAVGIALAAALSALEDAGATGRLTVRLARMMAFLSPDGIGLRLLRRNAMLAQLGSLADPDDAAELENDPILYESVLHLGMRYGFYDIEWHASQVRMHRVVGRSLRGLMSADEAETSRLSVQLGLARSSPNEAEVEDHNFHPNHRELYRHIVPSNAAETQDREVRRWLVRQVQYMTRYGGRPERENALALADSLAGQWPESERDHDLRLRIDEQRARLHEELGDRGRAVELLDNALRQMRELAGTRSPRTLLMSRPAGRYLRSEGRFREAQIADHVCHEGLCRVIGPGHPNTLYAAENLAVTSYLAGDVNEAIQLQERVLNSWVQQTGWDGPKPWVAAANLGFFLKEMGRYEEARVYLQRSSDVSTRRRDGDDTVEVRLDIARSLATIRRCVGDPSRAENEHRSALEEYRDRLGDNDSGLLASELSLVLARFAAGEQGEALAEARVIAARYARAYAGGHPYAIAARINLCGMLGAADHTSEAAEIADRAAVDLEERLGSRHPWRFAALINGAANRERSELDRIARDARNFLTPAHPYSRLASANRRSPSSYRPALIDIPTF